MLRRFYTWLSFAGEPDIRVAQYGELKRQIPLLYALLILNASAVSYTHFAYAPGWLTLGVAGLLISVSCWRLLIWAFAPPVVAIDATVARRTLRRTTILAAPLCVAFVSWSLALYQYGGPLEQAHVALFIAVTVIGCIFCLISVPQAALLVTVTVMSPYLVYNFFHGNAVFTAMALNIALVTGVMIRVLLNSFAGFATLIRSQVSLAAEQAEAERLSSENARLALTDVLTGLPNRRHFFAQLDSVLRSRKMTGERFAVGVLDLDRFKPVNDTYGHVFGDRLLAAVGARLASRATDACEVARLGGDEFGILILDDIDRAREIGQRICDLLTEPFDIEGQRIVLGCSGGVATFPDAGSSVHQLFDRSDYALYHVKSLGPGVCALFSAEHETLIRSERAIEAAMHTADFDTELHVQFQPIFCTETMAVLGVEALGRWTSPTLGAIKPDQFIMAAERLGFMHAITASLFRNALACFARMPEHIGLSFNLSARDIVSTDTIDLLIDIIERGDIDPKRITFELTETALMRDFEAAVASIKRLRALGIRIALDDFGSGYSSLSYLHRLPLDKVKVDRSFIADMDEASGRNIISAILGLCQTLGLDCIIEGVETDGQLQQLRDIGYRMAQGYLFARPMGLEAFLKSFDRGWAADFRPMSSGKPKLQIVA
ncbi:EAL domain-containing protein [Sphingomonas sp. H39-1-10]|uniref:putative bifunctional diguanylate cyclase/phosphodiesterase n=1 Tax=Sphingomonas pollutisoli TaxID=3030829 RepID=UPI0023B899B1|nr:EAL domain-containing protein [Sphingomonas pollutisoli]MDF0487937.1 EAL domain-containing protein [Sphingomonas pollutisoli]